ncbi:imelysin [Dyadobacter sp. CY261]|uniref:imelysin family protein n=1 Tax=Dyadobacter sp. CY261 TaxID=2907203 RepID=UPI001F309F08|nr:imelysin family protein [Dyadobacter sp. CY261]MCF0072956.1 imelysin [Dyadobacter sp. CY261]
MKRFIIPVFLLGCLAACDSDDDDDQNITPTVTTQEVVNNYADLVLANYDDAWKLAKDLQAQVNAFVQNPTAKGLEDSKAAWLASRVPYLQTEAFRFYDGPIDGTEENLEGLINSWPLDEAYIDYVKEEKAPGGINYLAGVINNLKDYPTISEEVLLADNGKNGDTDVKVGYHAIEFLLWGQDLYDDSAGKRPYTDYVKGGTAQNQERRAQYLKIVTDLLVKDLEKVKAQWETAGAYRKDFTAAANVTQSLTNMMLGMGKLTKGELSGERMTVILASKDQEDEHSCFSDNTHNDYIYDEAGIYNVYLGRYKRVDGTTLDGPGIDDLVKAKSIDINAQITTGMDAATAAVKAIPAPVDQAVKNARPAMEAAIKSLRAQADLITLAGSTIGINLSIPETN